MEKFMNKNILVIIIALVGFYNLPSLIGDCTDTRARNYNPDAWMTDNSKCNYLTDAQYKQIWQGLLESVSDTSPCKVCCYDNYSECIDMGCDWEGYTDSDGFYNGSCIENY